MAKFKPIPSVSAMEESLGFTSNLMISFCIASDRFYCDLKPIANQLLREHEEFDKLNQLNQQTGQNPGGDLVVDHTVLIQGGDSQTIIKRTDHAGLYRYLVDIRLEGGFFLPLLFTETEVLRTVSTTKISHYQDPAKSWFNIESPPPIESLRGQSMLWRLPKELRDKIYSFALPPRELGIKDINAFDRHCFPKAIGDPDGLFFQLGAEPAILRTSKMIRQESLPFAYRHTNFYLDDLDDVVKFLVSIGRIGRSNIAFLHFPWEGKDETKSRLEESPDDENAAFGLPTRHVLKCIQLLKMCTRLESLQIRIDRSMLETQSSQRFMEDPAIMALCSLKGVRTLEVVDYSLESLEEHPAIRLLRRELERIEH